MMKGSQTMHFTGEGWSLRSRHQDPGKKRNDWLRRDLGEMIERDLMWISKQDVSYPWVNHLISDCHFLLFSDYCQDN